MEVWRGSQEGLDVVIVNPGVILGSGFWDAGSGQLFSKIHKGLQYYTQGVTGFIGVQDVVYCMEKLMEEPIANERFILVSENKSYQELLFSIADAFQTKRPVKKLKEWQINFFWRWEWLISKMTSRKVRLSRLGAKTLNSQTYYSSNKISKHLGIKFQSIDKVVKEVVKDFSL